MRMHTSPLPAGRINKYKGEILKHAVPMEVLGKPGRQIPMPRNNSDTYVARRWLPYGATATSASTQNTFFQNATGDRGNVITQAHQVQEGVKPPPDSMVPLYITVVVQQFGCLYGLTDLTYNLYVDDITNILIAQIGDRASLVSELSIYQA